MHALVKKNRVDSIEALQRMTKRDSIDVIINGISKKLLIAEYDEAAESIESLLKELENGTR